MKYRLYDRITNQVEDPWNLYIDSRGFVFTIDSTGIPVQVFNFRVDSFTGIVDSDNSPLYENDIVSFTSNGNAMTGLIKFDIQKCCFLFGELSMADSFLYLSNKSIKNLKKIGTLNEIFEPNL